MEELRNHLSSTTIPQTGTLVVTHVVDLDVLRADHGESVPVDEIAKAGVWEVSLLRHRKKTRIVKRGHTPAEASAYVEGFKACADVRRKKARKATAGAE